jgi:hypothetical protein
MSWKLWIRLEQRSALMSKEDFRFQHTPYDGSSHPFTVGLKPIDEGEWLEPDAFLVPHLAEKDRLVSERRDAVLRAEDGTEEAQREMLSLIVENLKQYHGKTHKFEAGRVVIADRGPVVDLSNAPALLTAARLVQEDLVLMRPGPDGYRLAAASLSFPSSWSLAEKFSKSMSAIHETVPGFNGERMGIMVARLFDNLKVGQCVCRFNWSIYPDDELYNPKPHRIDMRDDVPLLSRLFLRVERQTLRRLPGSGDIIFTIKIHHDPLRALVGHPERGQLAGQLRTQLMALDPDQLRYKGLANARDELARALSELSTSEAGVM